MLRRCGPRRTLWVEDNGVRCGVVEIEELFIGSVCVLLLHKVFGILAQRRN
jgi:hypothetical protein